MAHLFPLDTLGTQNEKKQYLNECLYAVLMQPGAKLENAKESQRHFFFKANLKFKVNAIQKSSLINL